MNFWRFDTADPALGRVMDGTYEPVLVALSIVIACFAGITALMLADRMMASRSAPARAWWHFGGAVAMGFGIWAMHFTGMLAFTVEDHRHVGYDLGLTLISLLPAVFGSGMALYFIAYPRQTHSRLQLCALLMALGIGTMHYTGMEAMRLEGLRYDFQLFVLSLVVAHALALAALSIRFGLHRLVFLPEHRMTMLAGIVMGFAVAGMHYTAMGASRFYAVPGGEMRGALFSDATLAATIGGFAAVILGLGMVASWIDRQIEFQRIRNLEQIAHTDPLTGLPNRAQFRERLQHALDHGRRQGDRLAILFLDLNGFKSINDSLGHAAGDHVLKTVAARIQSSLRDEDMAARHGGDEFVVMLWGLARAEDAVDTAQRILRSLGVPIEFEDRTLQVSASIGISVFPDDSETVDELNEQADAAMYRAKLKGSGYGFFDAELSARASERARLGDALREALKQEQSFFRYQPWVDLASGDWLGVEALARWIHPSEGEIPPDVFIPLAERSGLILQFGEWALRHVCRQGRAWLDAGLEFGRIAVNVSAPQFARQDFVAQLNAMLKATGLPGSRLELELGEGCLMQDTAQLKQRLLELRSLGVSVAIDEFGTGFFSLRHLKELPLDKLKIGREFVRGVPDDPQDLAIARAIIDMSASLGCSVVCVGIENETQRDKLMRLGCRLGQGFLFSPPRNLAEIKAALADTGRPAPGLRPHPDVAPDGA